LGADPASALAFTGSDATSAAAVGLGTAAVGAAAITVASRLRRSHQGAAAPEHQVREQGRHRPDSDTTPS
jgi:hypothetical protein